MGRVGRPPSIEAPPCPACGRAEAVASHGLQDIDGLPRRAFRCEDCEDVFVPGASSDDDAEDASRALRSAVSRVRLETEAPYRLIANALDRHLGVGVSHTTVRTWCEQGGPDASSEDAEEGELACEYLSVLWALRHEIKDEAQADPDG